MEKCLKEIQSTAPVNRRIRKQSNFTADMEKIVVVWIDGQTSHNIHSLKPKPNPEQGSYSLQFPEGWEVRKLQKKSLKLAEVGSWDMSGKTLSL